LGVCTDSVQRGPQSAQLDTVRFGEDTKPKANHMRVIGFFFLSLIACVVLGAYAAGTRYEVSKAENGVYRLDRWTGKLTFCGPHECHSIVEGPKEFSRMQSENVQMRAELGKLHGEIRALEGQLAIAELKPSPEALEDLREKAESELVPKNHEDGRDLGLGESVGRESGRP